MTARVRLLVRSMVPLIVMAATTVGCAASPDSDDGTPGSVGPGTSDLPVGSSVDASLDD